MLKKLSIISIAAVLIFTGCKNSSDFKGWAVNNKTENDVIVKFQANSETAKANSISYFDYAEDTTVSIDPSFHVAGRIENWYQDGDYYKGIEINALTEIKYVIINSTADVLTMQWKYADEESFSEEKISPYAKINKSFWNSKPEIVFLKGKNHSVHYTEMYNGDEKTYYINLD